MSDPIDSFFNGAGEQAVRELTKAISDGCERDYEAGGITKIVEDEWKDGWKRDYDGGGISSASRTRKEKYA